MNGGGGETEKWSQQGGEHRHRAFLQWTAQPPGQGSGSKDVDKEVHRGVGAEAVIFFITILEMEIQRLPNLINLKMEHLIDPSPPGTKVIPIDFSDIDYCDSSGRPISFKACKSGGDLTEWYRERISGYPEDLAPFLAYKTMHPNKDFPRQKKKGGFSKMLGNFNIRLS